MVETMKHDDVNKTLSAWMDDEALSEQDNDALYRKLVDSEEGARSFESFHAIRAVLSNESSAHWQAGFSERVGAAIADEPTVLAPRPTSKTKKMFTGWAVAASVALSVVIGVQWYPGDQAGNHVGPMVADGTDLEASDNMLAEYHVTGEEKAQLERINTIFSKFAQSPQTGSGALPYVRLVSGEQVKTFRMTPRQFQQVMVELEKRNREAERKAKLELNQPEP